MRIPSGFNVPKCAQCFQGSKLIYSAFIAQIKYTDWITEKCALLNAKKVWKFFVLFSHIFKYRCWMVSRVGVKGAKSFPSNVLKLTCRFSQNMTFSFTILIWRKTKKGKKSPTSHPAISWSISKPFGSGSGDRGQNSRLSANRVLWQRFILMMSKVHCPSILHSQAIYLAIKSTKLVLPSRRISIAVQKISGSNIRAKCVEMCPHNHKNILAWRKKRSPSKNCHKSFTEIKIRNVDCILFFALLS